MKILTPITRDEWLGIRMGYVSSTESSALFGRNPYLTAFELGVSKKNAKVEDAGLGERPKWGLRLQDTIAYGVALDFGISIRSYGLNYAVDDDARMGSSFDYEIIGTTMDATVESSMLRRMYEQNGPGLLEIKNVDSLEFKNKWSVVNGLVEAPDHIEIQLQHQLSTIGKSWGCVAAFVGGNRIALFVRTHDTKVTKVIRGKVKQFWDNFDKGILPDPLMPDDASVIVALYQYAEEGKYFDGQTDEKLEEWMARYKGVAANISALEKEKQVAKAAILEIVKDAERAESKGFNLSAATRAPVRIEAHERAGYRDFRITPKKEAKK